MLSQVFLNTRRLAKGTQSLKMAGNSIPRGLKKCYSNENTMKPENNILMYGELKYPEIALHK